MEHMDARNGEPERPEQSEEQNAASSPEESLDHQRGTFGEAMRRLLETHDGREEILYRLSDEDAPREIFELSPDERSAFASRWSDGFLRQVMLGEFDLEKPLSSEEEAELLTSEDPRRRWMLETRHRLSDRNREEL
jgi:hypothetical protein